ncbi:hypothetical protein AB9P05_12940 [Roseivirga sp. BDSF3-8]|uniref:hypothetical protein n=1 Tax=Roseivirga sp. BDSF3-8 TaxID=3241598 RepID=UPI0035327198
MKILSMVLIAAFSSLFAPEQPDSPEDTALSESMDQTSYIRIWGTLPAGGSLGGSCFTITDCQYGVDYDVYASGVFYEPGEIYEIYLSPGSSSSCADYELVGADGPIACGVHQI